MNALRMIAIGAVLCPASFAQTDADVRKRIEQVAAAANRIQIDGRSSDWAAIPMMIDSPVDGRAGGPQDIIAVAIAPRADDLLILIETDAPPPVTPNAFMVTIDLLGSPDDDFLLGIGVNGLSTIALYDGLDANEYQKAAEVEAEVGDAVEARLPYSMLRALLPLEMRRKFAGANARTWMRATPHAWDVKKKRYVDFAPAVASFRLEPMPELDSPIEKPIQAPLVIPPPFRGRWFISQGAFGEFTHQDEWSYDFEIVNEHIFAAPRGVSPANVDHYSWDQPVLAPAAGGIIRLENDAKDTPPYRPPPSGTPVNGVYVKVNDDNALWLGHFRQGSISVRPGEVVSRGAELGRVGNSGQSNRPHLHIAAFKLPSGLKTRPIAFSNVIVSLNPIPNDPWARRLTQWDLHEGMFVEGF